MARFDKPLFADPKNPRIFNKAFSTQAGKGSLVALLNSLLRLPDSARIVDLEYLSPEQLPPHDGLKLLILDVKCIDAQGSRYVVEMQVFPVESWRKWVVFNACKAYVEQLDAGQTYGQLCDVVAVTICNFQLWPERVGMLSRWRMREEESGDAGLSQIQYVFLELAKYPEGKKPKTTVEKWAWFFREVGNLREIPDVLNEAPYLSALDAVKRVNFSDEEWTEYQREKMAEEDFHGGLSLARKEGFGEGVDVGEAKGLRQGVLDLCEVLDIALGDVARARINELDVVGLTDLTSHIKRTRAWPKG